VFCEKNDLILVPSGIPHWFDMGENPHFVAIRLFSDPEGLAVMLTGDAIAEGFPRLDD
jgi:1,2-dihydroxy-3-keto-5-methylthiopentene dioxygenase